MIPVTRYKNSPGRIHSNRPIIRPTIFICVVQFLVSSMASSSVFVSASSEIDPMLRNFKLIRSKVIPDVSSIVKINEDDDSLMDHVRQFIFAGGFTALESDGYKIRRDIPFTIVVPNIDMKTIEKSRLKDFVLEHLVPGKVFQQFSSDEVYGNSLGNKIILKTTTDHKWTINDIKVTGTHQINENLATITIDGFLGDRKTAFAKRNIQETNRYNEPQRLEMKNATTKHEPTPAKDTKISPLMTFLSSMKSGTKVFQHFLLKSNLTQVMDEGHYTILIPSDNAFQRWHPIDWGFYPFSVQEFTENVMRNHFLESPNPLRMADVKTSNKLVYRTLGGESVVFKNNPSPSVNNVSILGDYTLPNGNQIFIISEVLFVSEAVVSKLHQMHKDKETPPLLAFPWFGAQFLSHSFLALERDTRFTQITRYLNNAEIAPYVSGANFTFFVPTDEAFERIGFDLIPDDILASPKGVKMLLNHFIKGRLYDRDLKDNEVFETLGGGVVKIQRKPGSNVTVNLARITESEVFVYNLGTMFYIDDILYSDILREYAATSSSSRVPTATSSPSTPPFPTIQTNGARAGGTESSGNGIGFAKIPNTATTALGTNSDVEIVPNEFITEQSGVPDILMPHDDDDDLEDDEIITPKALPVRFHFDLPK